MAILPRSPETDPTDTLPFPLVDMREDDVTSFDHVEASTLAFIIDSLRTSGDYRPGLLFTGLDLEPLATNRSLGDKVSTFAVTEDEYSAEAAYLDERGYKKDIDTPRSYAMSDGDVPGVIVLDPDAFAEDPAEPYVYTLKPNRTMDSATVMACRLPLL